MSSVLVETSRAVHALDVTDRVALPGVANGFLWLAVPHTTAALILCEADDEMLADLERAASELFKPLEPFQHARHGKCNAAAHLVSALAGTQLVLRVENGMLVLGEWQRIVLLELDGPKDRTLEVRPLSLRP